MIISEQALADALVVSIGVIYLVGLLLWVNEKRRRAGSGTHVKSNNRRRFDWEIKKARRDFCQRSNDEVRLLRGL